MAKLAAYKMVSPTVTKSVKGSLKIAVHSHLDSINNLGKSINSVGNLTSDLVKISRAFDKTTLEQAVADRRLKRRKKDAAAENRQEGKKLDKFDQNGKSKEVEAELKKKKKADAEGKNKKTGLGGFLTKFLGPVGQVAMTVGAAFAAYKITEYFSKPENIEKIKIFLEKSSFVFNKIFEFGQALIGGAFTAIDNLFGEKKNILERLQGFGTVAAAIGGMAIALKGVDLLAGLIGGDERERQDQKDKKKKKKPEVDPENPKKKLKADEVVDNGKVRKATPDEIKMKKAGLDSDAIADARKRIDAGEDFATATRKAGRGKGLGARIMNQADDFGSMLMKKGKGAIEGAATGIRKGLQNADIGQKLLKKFKQIKGIGKSLASKGAGKLAQIKGDLAKAGDWVGGGLNKLGSNIKETLVKRVLKPLKPFTDPIIAFAKKQGENLYNLVMKTPAGAMVEKYLKTKGLSLAKPGPLGKKIGSKALPMVGGLVNMLFAYDRLASGDVIGGALEGLSGALDISGLFGFVPGPMMSMGLDAFMFARDFIPAIQEFEQNTIAKIPGFSQLYPKVEALAKKLPDLGTIVKMITGGNKEEKEKETERKISPNKKGGDLEKLQMHLAEKELAAFEKKSDIEDAALMEYLDTGEYPEGYTGPKVKGTFSEGGHVIPEFSAGGLSDQIAMASTMEDIIPIPIVVQQLALIPKAVPINKGSRSVSMSSITSRRL